MHISVKCAVFSALVLAPALVSPTFSNPAFAADLPTFSTVYPEAQASIIPTEDALPWQGFHFGVITSYSKFTDDVSIGSFTQSSSISGASVGGLAGFDIQMGNLVLGAEADTSFGNISGANSAVAAEIRQFSTFRGRVGYAVGDLLFYGTGGYALADMTVKSRFFGQDNQLVSGWTYGGGVEAKLTQNISVRGEYLYTKLDKTDVEFSPYRVPGKSEANDFHTFRAALSYQLPIM